MSKLCVRDLMTTEVFAVRTEDSLTKVQELMREKDIRHAPVVDEGGTLVGLVSERDVLRRAFGPEAELAVQAEQAPRVKAEDVMTCEVETVEPGEDAATAARIMLDNKYRLPPCDRGRHTGRYPYRSRFRAVFRSRTGGGGTDRGTKTSRRAHFGAADREIEMSAPPGTRGTTIVKAGLASPAAPNLADYDRARRDFSWAGARTKLDGLAGGRGLNIAHEAIDRHASGPLQQRVALRWISKTGDRRDFTYADLRDGTNRFANVLKALVWPRATSWRRSPDESPSCI